jgi:hypothetical protein
MGLNKNTVSSDVTAGTTGTAAEYNNLREDARLNIKDDFSDSDGATITFDMSPATGAPIHKVTLGGNRTLVFSGMLVGQHFRIELTQDGTGSRTVTWPANITWVNSLAPVLTTTNGKKDVFIFYCTSLKAGPGSTPTYDGYIAGQNMG